MLTSDRAANQIKKQIRKERDQENWNRDIHRYSRYKKIIHHLEKNNRDTSFWMNQLHKIREKYPNVKNWP